MGNICNPTSMRLGHHAFWVLQNNFTKGNHCDLMTRYRNQNYIFLLQHLTDWFFSAKFRKIFYMRLFTIYKGIQINFVGYYPRHTFIHLQILLYDFNIHVVNNAGVSWRTLRYAIGSRLRSMRMDVKYKRKDLLLHKNLKILTRFMGKYLESFHVVRRTIKLYFRRFMKLVVRCGLIQRINRVHKMYFNHIPYRITYRMITISEVLDAQFIATYIERRLRTGGYIHKIIGQVTGFIRRSPYILGYKLCCSGRFQRGPRKGYVWRVKGQYSYGSFSNDYHMQYATASTIVRKGMCGVKVWLVTRGWKKKKLE